ncbi:C-5 cytosine-specific DNA methylase-domain-containing protein [Phlyctochytrium arcticum]|nr:C-5 cytosine-specific DNA methylase-domain-containing protein [Phlyctochytrium arcticum]
MGVEYIHQWSSDIDQNCLNMIAANHHPKQIFEDITKQEFLDLPEIDLYVAGFPCQPYSSLRHMGKKEEKEDHRKDVAAHCIATILHTKPAAFLLEKVPLLVSYEKGQTFANILADLTKTNEYNVQV